MGSVDISPFAAVPFGGIREVIAGPLPDIACRFSRFVAPAIPHAALVIFTRECTGRPRKVAGQTDIVDRVTIDELEALKHSIRPNDTFDGEAVIAGLPRPVWATLDDTDTLLVIVVRPTPIRSAETDWVREAFGIVATSIRQQVVQASPAYLAESRAASSERARAITELSEMHETTLVSLLATLRSHDLDDRRARLTASETASAALIALRTAGATDRELSEEAVTTAFARLQGELKPLLRHRDVRVEYVDPPADGRALPGEVAHAARAIVRATVLAFAEQQIFDRIRIAWDCDGNSLLIEIRDQGPGLLDTDALLRQISGRVQALRGDVTVESVERWGSRVSLAIPLDPPATRRDGHLPATLNPRELEVLGHLSAGRRNKMIADALGVSESTIKFHVGNVLKKLDVATRGEAGAIGMRAGIHSEVEAAQRSTPGDAG